MSLEHNKALVRRFFEEAPKRPELYDELLAPDFHVQPLHHATLNPEGNARGPEAYKAAARWLSTVWEGGRITVEEVLAEGDRVMARWTFRGRHQGELFGLPPTGREVAYAGINLFRIAAGRLAESWDLFDRLWLWQQLGVLPETGRFLQAARDARAGGA